MKRAITKCLGIADYNGNYPGSALEGHNLTMRAWQNEGDKEKHSRRKRRKTA
jgi:hypothetical protein